MCSSWRPDQLDIPVAWSTSCLAFIGVVYCKWSNIDTVFDLGEKDKLNSFRRFAKDVDEFQLHWELRDVIKEELRRDLETPEPKTLYMWADWKVIGFNFITKESQSPVENIRDIQ